MEFPKSAVSLMRVAAHERRARARRGKWEEKGVSVPPVLIVSATNDCNLHCTACYARRDQTAGMTAGQIAALLRQVSAAGCSMVFLAGGEPLLAPDWLHALSERPELLGLVFTNGTLFDGRWISFFSSHRHLIPLFSVEGSSERTDDRRGAGVTERIQTAMAGLHERNIPFGISVTTGAHNLDEVTRRAFAAPYLEIGCRLILYVEYVPVEGCGAFAPLSEKDKARLTAYCDTETGRAIRFVFPGDEDVYGGCLAAGRGFVHVAASGALTPCPFVPHSDRNLQTMSFLEALRSPLLEALRERADRMREGVGGCALRDQEAWIREIMAGAAVDQPPAGMRGV